MFSNVINTTDFSNVLHQVDRLAQFDTDATTVTTVTTVTKIDQAMTKPLDPYERLGTTIEDPLDHPDSVDRSQLDSVDSTMAKTMAFLTAISLL